jgi:hypothetical protein
MRRTLLATLVIGVALTATTAQAAVPSKYVDTKADEYTVATAAGFRAYGVAPHGTNHYRIRVRESGVGAYWVGTSSSVSWLGNIDLGNPLGGDVMTYAYSPTQKTTHWDVRVWNLDAQANVALPGGINTTKDEENPSISGDYLLYGRAPQGTVFSQRILLYRFSTDETITIAEAPDRGNVTSNVVAGDWAVYTACKANWVCNVFRYQISTGDTVKIPNPDRATYWPTVTTDGTVYYVLGSPRYCGYHTKIMRWNGGAASALFSFPNGIEIGQMSAVDEGSGPVVFFSRVDCGTNPKYGIWQIKG